MKLPESVNFLIRQLSDLLPKPPKAICWDRQLAAIWRSHSIGGQLVAYDKVDDIALEDLLCVDHQKAALDLNTRQFLQKLPANNALLWGVRGSGKSSLVHALLNHYADQGLRLLQVDKHDFKFFPDIIEKIQDEPYRFLLFCDDLSFDANDIAYKSLKSMLEGSIFTASSNVLLYATSNRRHLLPEYMEDNQNVSVQKHEIHHGEMVEEKVSLSDRFGLWLSFYAFNQTDYLTIAKHWVRQIASQYGQTMTLDEPATQEALRWALKRGSRSGRTAQHFARHWVGQRLLARLN